MSISYRADLLENSFMFCLSEMSLFCLYFLKDVEFWIDRSPPPRHTSKKSFHFLHPFFPLGMSSIFLIVLSYASSFFCCFQDFLFMACLDVVFFVLSCLGSLMFLGMGVNNFYRFWKILAFISLNACPPFSSLSRIPSGLC